VYVYEIVACVGLPEFLSKANILSVIMRFYPQSPSAYKYITQNYSIPHHLLIFMFFQLRNNFLLFVKHGSRYFENVLKGQGFFGPH